MKKLAIKFRLAVLLLAVFMSLTAVGCARGGQKPEETVSLAVITDTPAPEPAESAAPTETTTPELTAAPTEKPAPTETPAPDPTAAPTETPAPEPTAEPAPNPENEDLLDPDGTYTSKEDVALYLHQYGELPQNFMTKKDAKKLGWSGGGLDDYAYGYCIGGDRYGNYEGLLPDGNYHECDIDTLHKKKRGAKRIVYSDDGRIYYTDDHYASFTLLYGEE